MRYTFGVIQWTKTELQQLDKKTRRILTADGCLHPKPSIQRLYLHCSKGGCGITSIKDTHTHECTSLARYIQSSKDPLTQLFCDTPFPTQKALMKCADGPLASTPEEMDDAKEKLLLQKTLHGVFFKDQREIMQVDLDQSWQWLHTSGLRYETDAAICAVQEQALTTNNVCKKIGKKDVSPLCCH
eukprot:12825806-Ditylum_brightwellii.AAC.1